MERNKVALERERKQERERHENQCNAEQAVTKHFEESLRRAKEKQMRAGWTINTIPVSLQLPNQQHQPQPQQQQQQQQQHFPTNQQSVPASTQILSAKMPDEYVTNDLTGKRGFWPQQIYFNRKGNSSSEAQQSSHHQLQMPTAQLSRTHVPEYTSSQAHHELATVSQHPTTSQSSKNLNKIHVIKKDSVSPNSLPIFGYNYGNTAQYHKEIKPGKAEIHHTNPSSMIDQQSTGVIVKHDTSSKTSSIITHSAVEKIHPQMIIQHAPAMHQQSKSHHVQQQYNKVPTISTASVPLKSQLLANEHRYAPNFQHQTIQIQLPLPSASASAFHTTKQLVAPHQFHMTDVQIHSNDSDNLQSHDNEIERHKMSLQQQSLLFPSLQSKPKVSSPAPSKIYGRPSSISTDQLKISIIGPSNQTIIEPPPAHSHSQKYVLAHQPLRQSPNHHQNLSNLSPPIATVPLSRSPGIHLSPQISTINQSMYVQSKPLDLGITDRYRNDNSNSPIRKTSPMNPLALDTKSRVNHSPCPSGESKNASDQIEIRIESNQMHSISSELNELPKLPNTSFITIAPAKVLFANPTEQTMPTSDVPESNAKIDDKSNEKIEIERKQNRIECIANESNDKIGINLSNVQINPLRTNSTDGLIRASPAPSPNLSDKPSSPAAPRHLKKAWLQRHTIGEDSDSSVQFTNNTKTSSQNSSTTDNITTFNGDKDDSIKTSSIHSNSVDTVAVNNANKTTIATRSQPPKKSIASALALNPDNSDKMNDSSSSDQSSTSKSAVKRKLPKSKRRRAAFRRLNEDKKRKSQTSGIRVPSESEKESGDSDKDNMSDKDSDSTSASLNKKATNGTNNGNESSGSKEKEQITRKRGRRPKDEPDPYGKRRKTFNAKDAFRKPPILQLKKTCEPFLQDGPCFEVAPKLGKCRECRFTANQRLKSTSNIFCRFYAFRKLRYSKSGLLAIAGFSDPQKDPSDDELKLWCFDSDNSTRNLDLAQARYLIAKVGDLFCDLYVQEKMAISEQMSIDKAIAWKRVIRGVREMCDVCETTLFNYHWACTKCGFVVCIDCYKARKYGEKKIWSHDAVKDRDEFFWLLCTNRNGHDQERLMLTQVIAGDSLKKLAQRIHTDRALWNIPQNCDCLLRHNEPPKMTNGICKELIQSILKDNKQSGCDKFDFSSSDSESTIIKKEKIDPESSLCWLADVALKTEDQTKPNNENEFSIDTKTNEKEDVNEIKGTEDDNASDDSDSSCGDQQSTLRDLLIGSTNKSTPQSPTTEKKSDTDSDGTNKTLKKSHKEIFKKMMAETLEPSNRKQEFDNDLTNSMTRRNRFYVPIRVMTLSYSQELYPNVKHMWFCDGKLLRLLEPNDSNNLKIFQQQWKRGQPVLVSNVNKQLNLDLWRPESFSRDFGEDANDLVNCLTGTLVPNQPMKRFWDGFDFINKRIKDDNGEPMLLKLKDWPPGEDFAETLPTRFSDLMQALPLSDYTKRNGKFNLASRLPDCFVKPDLGPKMYNAYGSALYPTKGTTNLHLDISDAVNVMVYVGIPKDIETDNSHIEATYRAIDESGCDILQRRRIREKNQMPGALWHIYAPRDANKIRDLLNKVAIERGEKLEPNHDAIHDQSWYLDSTLRERLYKEYGVEGYAIAQCLGDSVFIPAGAPHQVRNLLNCIKVAEDFVSPENVFECFHLTHEFRNLTETHSNHEDKLQIKNIIYHAVKDALGVLSKELDDRINLSLIKTEIKEETDDDYNDQIQIKNEPMVIENNEISSNENNVQTDF